MDKAHHKPEYVVMVNTLGKVNSGSEFVTYTQYVKGHRSMIPISQDPIISVMK
ncbi:MAG TPA: hypothetical protein VKA34_02515 [Balneolales bacterium]|nr:hypothetical protein [Balneolales bacterium]